MPQPLCRLALTAALCLAGGAVATVMAAWGFGLWGRTTIDWSSKTPALQDVPELLRYLPPQALARYADGRSFAVRERGVGVVDSELTLAIDRSYPGATVWLRRAGWPRPALSCAYVGEPADQRWSYAWHPPPPTGKGIASYQWGTLSTLTRSHRMLPVGIEPAGFLLDTLLYGTILAGLVVIPGRMRRVARRRRGLCPSCGYSLSGLPPGGACPECGKAGS